MERKDIIGKEFTCFEFESDGTLSYGEQKNYIGLTGIVKEINASYPKYARVMITDRSGRKLEPHYPTDMILEQLKKLQEEEENKSVDDILNEMKQLIYRI
jgi:hypothetical protein